MNTAKFSMGNCGLLNEADRSMYKNKDTVSRSNIDKDKSKFNYNLCSHEQYTQSEIRTIHERIRGKKIRKDGIAFGCTIITLPKSFEGNVADFFEEAYKALKHIYRLKEEDVISAYVHLDETTPHMHFYFLPVHREGEKISMSWDKTIPRQTYRTQHRDMQRHLESKLGVKCEILNGKTLHIGDINKLTPSEKEQNMQLQLENENLNTEITEKEIKIENLNTKITKKEKKLEELQSKNDDIKNMKKRDIEAQIKYLNRQMDNNLISPEEYTKQYNFIKKSIEEFEEEYEELW